MPLLQIRYRQQSPGFRARLTVLPDFTLIGHDAVLAVVAVCDLRIIGAKAELAFAVSLLPMSRGASGAPMITSVDHIG